MPKRTRRRAYYNEFEPYAAEWLRNLIREGLIAHGDVDERSIVDVTAQDIKGYTQVHLFAGIGGWSHALRLAGWEDNAPVWTGSCPCPPFSAAGKRQTCPSCEERAAIPHPRKTGIFVCSVCEREWYADSRHLWPEMLRLVGECRPAVCFGEQVAAADGRLWLAGVRATLEALGYGVGAADLCAAGVGAPHIRQRLWWVADSTDGDRRSGKCDAKERVGSGTKRRIGPASRGVDCGLADTTSRGSIETARPIEASQDGLADARPDMSGQHAQGLGRRGGSRGLGNTDKCREGAVRGIQKRTRTEREGGTCRVGDAESEQVGSSGQSRRQPEADFWSDFDLVACADGKQRRVEPGTFPLDHGVPARVGKLRAYGNGIVPQVGAEFVMAYMETRT